MIRKTKKKKRGRKKLEMVRKSDYQKLEELLAESDLLINEMREQFKSEKEQWFKEFSFQNQKIRSMEREQERSLTVISSLGEIIQQLETRLQNTYNNTLNYNFEEPNKQDTQSTETLTNK